MASFEDGFVDTLKQEIPISRVMESFGITLKKTGRTLSCCSPFREEKTPSFHVYDDEASYHDYGDGNSGDTLKFIMDYKGVGFVDAVKELASIGGIPVAYKQTNFSKKQQSHFQSAKAIKEINAWASDEFNTSLQTDENALNYLTNLRGISKESIQKFNLGYAPKGWTFIKDQIKPELQGAMVKADLLVINNNGKLYDKFRDRIMFPIKDSRGDVVGFGGRIVTADDKTAKYTNTSNNAAYSKSEVLYGLHETLTENRNPPMITVVEGYLDVVKMHQYGFTSTVASSGTAISEAQIKKLLNYTDQLNFTFDGDKAGFSAACKAIDTVIPLIDDGKSVTVTFLPQGLDPDSILTDEKGATQLQRFLKDRMPMADFIYHRITEGKELFLARDGGSANRADISHNITSVAKKAVDTISTMPNGIYRDTVCSYIANALDLHPDRIMKAVDEKRLAENNLKQKRGATLAPIKTRHQRTM